MKNERYLPLQRGFTLIELLVVIAIIGLLASVVLVNLNRTRVIARETKRIADLRQLVTALELYYDDNGSYPDTGGRWWNSCSRPTNYIPGLSPTYIPSLPLDPINCTSNPTLRVYEYRSDGKGYKLLTHNETTEARFRHVFDPARDGGSDCTVVDGTTPTHFGFYTADGICW